MSVYLDASLLVSSFVTDAFSQRAEDFLRKVDDVVVVSDFAEAEFASALARRVRTGEMRSDAAKSAFASLDEWTVRTCQRVQISPLDVSVAALFLRGLDLPLRTADAVHIAAAQRIGAVLATFDERMASNAGQLGVPVAGA